MDKPEPLLAALVLAQVIGSGLLTVMLRLLDRPKIMSEAERAGAEAEDKEAVAETKRLDAINSLLGTVERFSVYVDRLIEERGEQSKRMDLLADRVRELDGQIQSRDERIASLEKSLAEKEQRISELEAAEATHKIERRELVQLRTDVTRLTGENESLRKQIAELRSPALPGTGSESSADPGKNEPENGRKSSVGTEKKTPGGPSG